MDGMRGHDENKPKSVDVFFSKLTKFSANRRLSNDSSSTKSPADSPALVVLWYSSGLMIQRLGVHIPAVVGEFFNFLKLLLQTGNWQLVPIWKKNFW